MTRLMIALMVVCCGHTIGCKSRTSPSDAGLTMKIKSIKKITPLPKKRRRLDDLVKHDPSSLLGGEQGLDHVGVAVKDLDGARKIYSEKLGFGSPQEGKLPNGLKNVNFYFGDTTYLELVTYYDRQKNPWVASFVDRHEKGAMFLMLCVYSYAHTANFLRRRGFEVGNPLPGRIETKGARNPQPGRRRAPMWVNFTLKDKGLSGNVSFIAYSRRMRNYMLRRLKDEKLRRKTFSHPNTALGLRSAWIAVKQLKPARKVFESIGLQGGRDFDMKPLDARGSEIKAGQGTLMLVEPRHRARGPVADFLKRRGEGIVGLSFEVESLETARRLIENRAKIKLEPYDGPLGRAFMVPQEQAFGVYLELFEKKR